MTPSNDTASTERMSRTAGIFTAIAGSVLLAAPERLGRVVGITGKRDAQLVAFVDLALAPGLILGRPAWPWLTARAVSNVATAVFVLSRADDASSRRRAGIFSALLTVATFADAHGVRASVARS
jgi:hypothetical protein